MYTCFPPPINLPPTITKNPLKNPTLIALALSSEQLQVTPFRYMELYLSNYYNHLSLVLKHHKKVLY
ncbi:hypothetical protein MIMGU_mgv1a017576mg [Erythranthe guttata]|uniref:Uncharacterized protein n=1 Tax=Erythranthe guttata TaxID=4155 RepID=A0A022RGZ2_ERYGU|nr:hypothetical protein MIMGU_mgv1a017576mg [Erythranthe guttata]